jgi:hypothetical protein
MEGNQLHNLITHAYIPDEYVQQILEIDVIGQKLYTEYVSERLNGDFSLWAPVKRENNKMYMSANSKRRVKWRDSVVDLKETKDIFLTDCLLDQTEILTRGKQLEVMNFR